MPDLQSPAAQSAESASDAFAWIAGLTPTSLAGLQLGMNETLLPDADAARQQFEQFRGMAFESVLPSSLLMRIQTLCDTGTFVSNTTRPGHREMETPQRAGTALNLVLCRSSFLRWLEETTGAGPLRGIAGSVVQMLPRAGDELRWHDDRPRHKANDDRRLAVVLNLGTQPFTGGEFELRRKSGEMLLQHKHIAPGSMLIFRVSEDLEHRVRPLSSGGPRRVFAGWALGIAQP